MMGKMEHLEADKVSINQKRRAEPKDKSGPQISANGNQGMKVQDPGERDIAQVGKWIFCSFTPWRPCYFSAWNKRMGSRKRPNRCP